MELRVENLSKVFVIGTVAYTVLKELTFSVHEGQFVALLGPSGCGKTTLLTIIAGFQAASGGRVLVNGRQVTRPGPDRGFVFQNYALFPWMTVRDNILFPMKQRRVPAPERERRLKELLAMAQLEGKERLYPHQLSGGMKQRTAFVRALAGRPEVLLMDEPLGAVDHQMRQTLQEELEALWLKDKTTVIMVTHDVDEAVYLGDRVIVMSAREGRIIEDTPISLPRPRDRKSKRYGKYKEHLAGILKNDVVRDPDLLRQESRLSLA
ncbi:MAG: ABC transporter ATP-binding protein [Pelotomaculum sp.]|uniref:ABC-type nitrate/sulfonate/bicarbonate transport system, ATPase component n=1 Tax=Pelotomaculum thermopropionicum (strain DSM 13744 / JCM 10971 / SI) TaxID=370438 RepID=A5D4T4_PELTS|nr:ABC transporter ATP-binding protein [Pelotomaculum sp.]BAF58757.1 ABC-type nitrate/sulfonate/bicarbonate transport system, ATPase component [Pelotomaculum thermopropionicum SI]